VRRVRYFLAAGLVKSVVAYDLSSEMLDVVNIVTQQGIIGKLLLLIIVLMLLRVDIHYIIGVMLDLRCVKLLEC